MLSAVKGQGLRIVTKGGLLMSRLLLPMANNGNFSGVGKEALAAVDPGLKRSDLPED